MADPNTNESRMKTKAGRDSRRLQIGTSLLQNTYHRGVSAVCSRDSRTEAVCERMWLLRILTCFAYARRTSWPNRPTDSTWLAGNRSFVAIAMFWRAGQLHLVGVDARAVILAVDAGEVSGVREIVVTARLVHRRRSSAIRYTINSNT